MTEKLPFQILSDEERARLLAKWKTKKGRDAMTNQARRFWLNVSKGEELTTSVEEEPTAEPSTDGTRYGSFTIKTPLGLTLG